MPCHIGPLGSCKGRFWPGRAGIKLALALKILRATGSNPRSRSTGGHGSKLIHSDLTRSLQQQRACCESSRWYGTIRGASERVDSPPTHKPAKQRAGPQTTPRPHHSVITQENRTS